MSEHDEYCDTHFDQYPWECTCGATYRQQRDTIEAQAAEIERLREALSDILTRFEPWSPHDYIADKAARAALGETP